MAETELTQALYAVVTNASSPTYPNRPKTFTYSPYYSMSSSSSSSFFLSILNNLTSINFRLPTIEEWLYAAKGGDLSKGYIYSGSDVISEVAWYNSNSAGNVHDVAQLMPNELGFYDMSGNVMEWTSSQPSSSSTSSYYCGGDYASSASRCLVTSYDYTYSVSNCGIRLALSIN